MHFLLMLYLQTRLYVKMINYQSFFIFLLVTVVTDVLLVAVAVVVVTVVLAVTTIPVVVKFAMGVVVAIG